jgi:periplasmic protein CpxP/Spy
MQLKHTLVAGLIGSLAAMSVGTALAATSEAGCPGARARMAGQAHGDMTAMAQQRLARLKTALKITAAQDSAWQAFANQMTQSMAAHQATRQAQGAPTGTAPERMGQHIEMLKQRLADMTAGQAAMQDLYSVLTTEQRAVVDQHFARMAGPGGPGPGPAQ